MEEIIEQGEGARGDWRHAHYGRFLDVWEEYRALRERDPAFQPAHPVLAAFTRQPFDIPAAQPVITDSLTLHIAELAGLGYETVLQLLLRFFTHTDETDEQLGVLFGGAIRAMTGVVRPLAAVLTRLPVGPEHPARTAGFGFQMYYTMGNLVPWREPAWALLHERMSLLVEHCTAATDKHGPVEAIRQAHEQAAAISTALAAHVPADLLAH